MSEKQESNILENYYRKRFDEPASAVLGFKSHDKRKTNTPNTKQRWVRGEGETDWDVVRGFGSA